MENQLITGHRALSPEEIALMNKIKVKAIELQALIALINGKNHLDTPLPHETLGEPAFNPNRAVAEARTCFQTGFMWLVRAVARPTTF